MKIKIPSSTEESCSTLEIRNVEESETEVLITIQNDNEEFNIYVLKENLKKALLKIM